MVVHVAGCAANIDPEPLPLDYRKGRRAQYRRPREKSLDPEAAPGENIAFLQ